jgi:hypothetical protein
MTAVTSIVGHTRFEGLPPPESYQVDRFHKSDDDYFKFIAQSGNREEFDIEKPINRGDYWYGLRGTLYQNWILFRDRTHQKERWVLVFAPPLLEPADPEGQHPPNRELSPADVYRWLRLNKHKLPEGLPPITIDDSDSRQGQPTRLDPEWRPSGNVAPGEPPPLSVETPPGALPPIRVDIETNQVFVGDDLHRVKNEQTAAFVEAVVKANGHYVTFEEMKSDYPVLEGGNQSRIYKGLPVALREFIQGSPGKGYLMKTKL